MRSKRARQRRRLKIVAVMIRQKFIREVWEALKDQPPGTYIIKHNLPGSPLIVEKPGLIH